MMSREWYYGLVLLRSSKMTAGWISVVFCEVFVFAVVFLECIQFGLINDACA